MPTAILEAVAREGAPGRAYRVRVIRAGLSRNGNFYPDAVLREAVALFDGARVFVKGDREHLAGQGKDVRNLIGALSAPRFVEGAGADQGAIEAVLTLILDDADPVATRLREAVANGLTGLFGLSVDALGTSAPGPRGVRVAQRFNKVLSVDLIVEPGAGGQVISFIEAAGTGGLMDREQLIAFLQANNPALLEGVDLEQASLEDLQAILARAIAPREAPIAEAEPGPAAPPSREETLAAIRALDASLIPADLSAVTDEELRAILERAKAAAAPAGGSAWKGKAWA